MESEQIEKRLNWIDEQRRKGTDLVVGLQEQITNALDQITSQDRQIKELSSEVARFTAHTSRIRQFDDDLTKQREDFSRRIDELLDSQAERDRQYEKIKAVDRDEISKSISELRMEIEALEEMKPILEIRRQEEIRITSKIDELEKSTDRISSIDEEAKRSISIIDEARKMDGKRITDLQVETTDVRKRVDSLRGMLDAVEDRSKKYENNLSEIVSSESGRGESQKLWVERQELKLIEFEKEWKKWNKAFQSFQKNADRVEERMLRYDENYRSMKQTRNELDKMVEKLERRISEISEIQRIAEDRLKQDWSVFLADDTKRWNTFKLNQDEQWREHTRIHDKIQIEMQEHGENITDSVQALTILAEKSQSRVLDLLRTVQDWAAEVKTKIGEVK
jgi:chromosome segregation ATPase